MTSPRLSVLAALATTLLVAASGPARADWPAGPAAVSVRDTMTFHPAGPSADTLSYTPAIQFFDSTGHEPLVVSPPVKLEYQPDTELLRAPMGDHLLDHPEAWDRDHHRHSEDFDMVVDYNRVDILRWGVHYQAQRPQTAFAEAKRSAIATFEKDYFSQLARGSKGNVSEMARQSGMERHHVRAYLRKYGIDKDAG